MFCSNCGRAVKDSARFCSGCGARLIPDPVSTPPKPAEQPAPAPIQQHSAQTAPAQSQPAAQSANSPSASPAVPSGNQHPAQPPIAEPFSYERPQPRVAPPPPPISSYPPAPGGRNDFPPSETHRAAPVRKKPRGRMIAWICGIAAVLAICIAAVFLFVLTPKNRVALAAKKSANAYAAAAEKVIPFDYAALAEKQAFSQEFSLGVSSIPHLALSRSLGLRLRVDTSIPDEYLGAEFALTAGDETLLSLRAAADGDLVYAGSPELLDSSYYGLNTRTLGKDISEPSLGLDPQGELADLSFNLFELYNDYLKAEPLDPSVSKDLFDALEVERQGSGKIRVNGNSLSCTEYLVAIPTDALADYLDAFNSTYMQSRSPERLRGMLRSMGLHEDMIENAVSGSENSDYAEFTDMSPLISGLREMDTDLELTVYVSGGYVVGVDYSGSNDYSDYELKIRLGGGKTYVNDLSIELNVDNETTLLLESSGDHMPKDGVFTDETTVDADGMQASFSCTYEPSASGDNFTLDCSFSDNRDFLVLNGSGRIEADKHTMNVALDSITLSDATASGERLTLSLGYVISDFEQGFTAKSPVSLFDLLESEINDIERTVNDNLEYILDRIDTLFPDLFWSLF